MRPADAVRPVGADPEPHHVGHDQQRRVLQRQRVLSELVERRVEIGAPPLVFPGEVVALPDVGPAVAAGVPARSSLEAVRLTRRVGVGWRRFAQQTAQVDEVLLRCRALLQFGGLPLRDELVWCHVYVQSRFGRLSRIAGDLHDFQFQDDLRGSQGGNSSSAARRFGSWPAPTRLVNGPRNAAALRRAFTFARIHDLRIRRSTSRDAQLRRLAAGEGEASGEVSGDRQRRALRARSAQSTAGPTEDATAAYFAERPTTMGAASSASTTATAACFRGTAHRRPAAVILPGTPWQTRRPPPNTGQRSTTHPDRFARIGDPPVARPRRAA